MSCFTAFTFSTPISHQLSAPKHQSVNVFAHDHINHSLPLQHCTLCLCFTWSLVNRQPKVLCQSPCLVFASPHTRFHLLVSLKRWSVWSIKDENRENVVL